MKQVPSSTSSDQSIGKTTYSAYLCGLLQGREKECAALVTELSQSGIDLVQLYTGLIQRSLYDVGKLWVDNTISTADEHLATAISERLITQIFNERARTAAPNGRSAILCCTTHEQHQIGARLVADFLTSRGWQALYLGANMPAEDLLIMIEETDPNLLGVSVSMSHNLADFKRLVNTVRASFPSLAIMFGGQAFEPGGKDFTHTSANLEYVPSLPALQELI